MATWFVFEKIGNEWQVNGRYAVEREAQAAFKAQERESLVLSDVEIGRAAQLLRDTKEQIGAFEKECAKKEHTDTDEVWHLLNRIYAEIGKVFAPARKRRKAKAAAKA